MRMLLAGGGTGGHLFPAIAIAQKLQEQDAAAEVLFVGTERGLEAKMLPKLGLPLKTVDMVGVVGRGWRGRLEMVPKLLKSISQAKQIIREFRPDLVVGVGGYASVPVLLAARKLKIATLLHEQNAIAGLGNRFLGKRVSRVCLSFTSCAESFPAEKVCVTGNPVRPALEQLGVGLPYNGKLLVFGGSRGARAINQVMVDMLPDLKDWADCPGIIHQTGEADFSRTRQAYQDAGMTNSQVVPFIDNMAEAYASAALVVCRSGATTLAELTVCGRPAILIPYPYAAADHQTANARVLERAGAALMISQDNLNGKDLVKLIRNLLNNRHELEAMANHCEKLGQPGAAERILDECRALVAG